MNALTKTLRLLGQHKPSLPSWAEYEACDAETRSEIETRWCSVGSGYSGDGSQRDEAFRLYCRAIALRKLPRQCSAALDDRGHDERVEFEERDQDYSEVGGMK